MDSDVYLDVTHQVQENGQMLRWETIPSDGNSFDNSRNIFSFIIDAIYSLLDSPIFTTIVIVFFAAWIFLYFIGITVEARKEKVHLEKLDNLPDESITVFSLENSSSDVFDNFSVREFIRHNTQFGALRKEVPMNDLLLHELHQKFKDKFSELEESVNIISVNKADFSHYESLFNETGGNIIMLSTNLEKEYFNLKNRLLRMKKDRDEYLENLYNKNNADPEVFSLFESNIDKVEKELVNKEFDILNNLKFKLAEQIEIEETVGEDEKDAELTLKTFNKIMNY